MFKARVRSKWGRSNRVSKIPDPIQRVGGAVARWSINDCIIRVRESGGNTERDFPPFNRKLDTASISDFVGANSGYVTKIYDKTGNGNHAIQTVLVSQPRLVNEGVYEVDENGDISPYYDGVDDYYSVSNTNGLNITSGGLSILVKHDADDSSFSGYIFSKNTDATGNIQYGLLSQSGNDTAFYLEGLKATDDDSSTREIKVTIATYDDVNANIYLNGILADTGAFSTLLTDKQNVTIGARCNNDITKERSIFYKGHISSVIIFNKALTESQVTSITNRLA